MPLVCELMKLYDLRSHRLISALTYVPMLNKCCYANVVFEFFGWRQWHFLHTVQSGVPFINSEAEHVTKEVRHFKPVPQNAILKTAKNPHALCSDPKWKGRHTLTAIWVWCRQNHAVYLPHLSHLGRDLVNESSDFFHLNQKKKVSPIISPHHSVTQTRTHPRSDGHLSEEALHEALSVHCDGSILLRLGRTL